MALLFCDTFDHYASAQLGDKWNGGASGFGVGASGRFSTSGVSANPGSVSGASLVWIAPSAFQTWIVGIAIKITGLSGTLIPIDLRDVSNTTQVNVVYNQLTQRLEVKRGGSSTILTSVARLPVNIYHYIELKAKIDNTVGTIDLWVNGFLDGTFSGDTQQTANANADRFVTLGANSGSSGLAWSLDDIYITDDAAGLSSIIGDPRVECLFPNGNGNSSQMVGSDGNSTDNYLLVDEATPNDDTDYVQSSTVGDKDTYTFGDMTTTAGTVYGVQVNTRARKTDAGARKLASVARLSGTEVDSADFVLTTSYQAYSDVRETKPGGGAWTISDVNSAEFGSKITA